MKRNRLFITLIFLLISSITVLGATRNSYTKYGKHLMPTYFDPVFINTFESCTPSDYMDWTGTYRYVVEGLDKGNICKYKTQYNPWLKLNKNEWQDYKICNFNEIQRNELTVALKEHSNRIKSYNIGAYKTTSTKLEYLLYTYEYYGACKLVKTK